MTSPANADSVFRFTMVIDGERVPLAFDPDPAKFLGEETLLVDRYVGGIFEWIGRVEAGNASGTDLLVVGYIAAHRDNPDLVWDEFVKVAAPFTIQAAEDTEGTAVVPNRSDRRAATRGGGRKPAAPKATATA